MRGNRLRATSCEYKKRRVPCVKTKGSPGDIMRVGSLTRFRTDEWYDQQGKGLVTDVLRGVSKALKGLEIH